MQGLTDSARCFLIVLCSLAIGVQLGESYRNQSWRKSAVRRGYGIVDSSGRFHWSNEPRFKAEVAVE